MSRQVGARMKLTAVGAVSSSSAALSAYYLVIFTAFFAIESVTGNGALVNGNDAGFSFLFSLLTKTINI